MFVTWIATNTFLNEVGITVLKQDHVLFITDSDQFLTNFWGVGCRMIKQKKPLNLSGFKMVVV